MAQIHVINSVKICLYSRDHNPPHIHAIYAEYEALVVIADGKVLRGDLPNAQLHEVREWLSNPNVKKRLVEMFHKMNPSLRRG
jgi:hypothetical protein